MTNNEMWTLLGVSAAIALGLMAWLAIFAAKVAMGFTMFVQLKLNTIFSILMFVIFPPSLFIFLVGLALIQFRYAKKAFDNND